MFMLFLCVHVFIFWKLDSFRDQSIERPNPVKLCCQRRAPWHSLPWFPKWVPSSQRTLSLLTLFLRVFVFLFVCLLILNSDSMILLLFLDLGQLYQSVQLNSLFSQRVPGPEGIFLVSSHQLALAETGESLWASGNALFGS